MTIARKQLGAEGEALAVSYLQNKGYHLLETNFRTKSGEVDCIFKDGDKLVFVEVKTRSNTDFGSPLEAVDRRKWQQITRVAEEYLRGHGGFDQPIRFDVVGVIINDGHSVEHIKDCFEGF